MAIMNRATGALRRLASDASGTYAACGVARAEALHLNNSPFTLLVALRDTGVEAQHIEFGLDLLARQLFQRLATL